MCANFFGFLPVFKTRTILILNSSRKVDVTFAYVRVSVEFSSLITVSLKWRQN